MFCTNNRVLILEYSQPAFICSKLTIETLEEGVKYVKVIDKDTRTTTMASFWYLYVNFEHISHIVLVFLLLTLNMQLPAGFRI